MHEIGALARYAGGGSPRAQAQTGELETRLSSLMGAMASLAAYIPLIGACFVFYSPFVLADHDTLAAIEHCFVNMRAAYAGMTRSG